MQHLVHFPMELTWLLGWNSWRGGCFPNSFIYHCSDSAISKHFGFSRTWKTSPCWGLPGDCFRMKRRSVARRLSSPSSRWFTCLFPEVRSPSSQEEGEVSAALGGQESTLHKRWISKQLSAIGTVWWIQRLSKTAEMNSHTSIQEEQVDTSKARILDFLQFSCRNILNFL